MSRPLVIYHKDCMDGFTAAWVAWVVHGGIADYLPAVYGDEAPDVSDRQWVIILDFSYPRDIMLKMKEQLGGKELSVLDHHKTAQAACEGLDFCIFDMNKSGAMLTWEWFNPHREAPELIKYVQDRDLRKFDLPNSKLVNAAIQNYGFTFENWDRLNSHPLDRLIHEGGAVRRYQETSIQRHIVQAHEDDICGAQGPCPLVNCTDLNIISELLRQLADKHPSKMAVSWSKKVGHKIYSIRSTDDGPDVSEIAKRFGGCGYKHAAGWVETLKEN